MEEFDIRTDKKRNRFYCILKGFFLESKMDLALDRISCELLKLTAGYDFILDIQNLKTSPDYVKKLFYEKLVHLTKSDCRYFFNINQNKNLKSVKKFGKSSFDNHSKIRMISHIQEAEDFLEQDYLLKNLFYN